MTDSSKKLRKSQPQSANKQYYPAFLDITGKRCIIIGGGKIAERKCSTLLGAGAEVTVISPEITGRLENYRKKGLIKHICRQYRSGDIKTAFIVISATGSEKTNRKAAADAAGRGVLLNVVDNPLLCNFIAPSILRRGPLTIAISTGGVSPAMAATIRRELEGLYGTDISRYLKFLRDIRTKAMKKIRDKTKRERFLKGLASRKMMKILIHEGFREAKKAALISCRKLYI